MFGVVSLTMGNSALPFAHRLVRHMQQLCQLPLGQALPFSLFGHKGAEGLFVQSDHLAVIVAGGAENATDRRFTWLFLTFSTG